MTDDRAVSTTAGTVARPSFQPSAADIPVGRAAVAGVVAAGVTLAFGELLAGLLPGAPSPLVAVGTAVIALQPPGAKDFVVALFGTNDKLALTIAVALVALLAGAGIGILARHHR